MKSAIVKFALKNIFWNIKLDYNLGNAKLLRRKNYIF